MKKQLSLKLRLLLLSGVAVFMTTSCMFMPPKDTKETIKTEAEEAEDGTTVYKKDGLTCVWHDEFDYEGVPDTSKWKYQTGHGNNGWGNQELQNYIDNTTEANTAVVEKSNGGLLKIKAKYEDGEWKSARLNSKQSWKYGYIEARMKITDRKGAWPAFWMMPEGRADWPFCGEIDIMENAPSTCGNHKVFSTLHAEDHNSGSGAGIGSSVYDEKLSSEWHTFGVKWTEDKITAYYDDEEAGSYTNNGLGETDWPYDKNFYIILNLAIGGNLGGPKSDVDSLNGNAEFLIDYVRVYQ